MTHGFPGLRGMVSKSSNTGEVSGKNFSPVLVSGSLPRLSSKSRCSQRNVRISLTRQPVNNRRPKRSSSVNGNTAVALPVLLLRRRVAESRHDSGTESEAAPGNAARRYMGWNRARVALGARRSSVNWRAGKARDSPRKVSPGVLGESVVRRLSLAPQGVGVRMPVQDASSATADRHEPWRAFRFADTSAMYSMARSAIVTCRAFRRWLASRGSSPSLTCTRARMARLRAWLTVSGP